jgi:hypothetical protein
MACGSESLQYLSFEEEMIKVPVWVPVLMDKSRNFLDFSCNT